MGFINSGGHGQGQQSRRRGGTDRPGGRSGRADFCLLRLALLVGPADFAGELLLELGHVFVFALGERLLDLAFEEKLLLGNLRFGGGLEVGDLSFLGGGQGAAGSLLFEAFHGEFVGAFHRGSCGLRVVSGGIRYRPVMPLSSPLPPPPATRNSPIRLLSTDFDGTVVNHETQPAVVPEFFAALAEMRAHGVQWAVNTGRVLWHIEEGLRELNFPVEPDYVLTSEREVFHRGPDGRWQDFGDWNLRCSVAHDQLFSNAGTLLADIETYLAAHTRAHPIYEGARLIGLAAESDDEMDGICAFLEKETARVPGFHFMRNTIYVRFCHEDYSKGTALAELARLTGLERGQIFAAGDHYNDLPMLDGRHAQWVACPGNAVEAVKRTVAGVGGYVAEGACSAGILQALRHFGVCSGEMGAANQ